MIKPWIETNLAVRDRIARFFGQQGDLPGGVLPGQQPVVISENFTDQRYLWLKRGTSWEVSSQRVNLDSTNVPVVIIRARPVVFTPGLTKLLIRFTRFRFWSTGSSADTIGYRILNNGITFPFLGSPNDFEPEPCDARQPLYTDNACPLKAVGGVQAINGPIFLDPGWAGRVPTQALAGVGPADFDPELTMRYGDELQIAGTNPTQAFGWSIRFQIWQASEQEWEAAIPQPG